MVEVMVVAALLFLMLMGVLMILPRQRENARLESCRMNLQQIGVALELYDRFPRTLPTIPRLDSVADKSAQGPLLALLEAFSIPDFALIKDRESPPTPIAGSVPGEIFVKSFACPTDPYATREPKKAAVSYRATTGDQPDGSNGPFAPGRLLKLSEVEEADGKSYTAAFSERLVGNSKPDASKVNYTASPGPIVAAGCPKAEASQWRGDAGESWREASWRSTLYNHAITPNAAPSCIAEDQVTALVGASSAHQAGVNLLMLDGSVRTVIATIEPKIWQGMATTSGSTSSK